MANKKPFNNYFLLGLISLFLIISLTPQVSAFQLCEWIPFWNCHDDVTGNTLSTVSWVTDYSTDNDTFVFIYNKSKKHTKVCLVSETATKKNDLKDKDMYKSDKSKKELKKTDKELKKELKKDKKNRKIETVDISNLDIKPKLKPITLKKKDTGLDKDYFGWCYDVKNKEKYLKFGNHSTVVTYVDDMLEVKDENGTILQQITLTENTDQCLINCYSKGSTVIYNDSKLFEGFDFKDRNNNIVSLSNANIYLEVETNTIKNITDYEYNCTNETIINGTNETIIETCEKILNCLNVTYGEPGNETITEECNYLIESYHNETITTYNYEPYNLSVLPAGSYNWMIKASKTSPIDIDWAVSLQGFDTDIVRQYWAWWNSNWTEKQLISNLTGEYPTFWINKSSEMSPGFQDLRFTNLSDNEELNYTFRSFSNATGLSYDDFDLNLLNNLVTYWDFDGSNSTTLIDILGENNGTNNGATVLQGGKINESWDFDGVSDYVSVNHDASLNFGSNGFSVSMWVNMDAYSSVQGIISKIGGSNNGWYLRRTADTTLNFYVGDIIGGNDHYGNVIATSLNVTGWHHIVIVNDGGLVGNAHIYYDTVEYIEGYTLQGSTDTIDNLKIGVWGSSYYDGRIDEVAIFNKTLSQSEVSKLYNVQRVFVTVDTNNQSEIYMYYGNNDTSLTTTENANDVFLNPIGAYFMDEGSGSYIHDVGGTYDDRLELQASASFTTGYIGNGMLSVGGSNSDGAKNTTVSSDFPSGNFNHTYLIWSKVTSLTSNDRGFVWRGNSGTNEVSALAGNPANDYQSLHYSNDKTFNVPIIVGEWVHLGYTYNKNTVTPTLYINGTQNSTGATHGTLNINDQYFDIGYGVGRNSPALLDEAFIYDRILSSTEINEIYSMSEQTPTFSPSGELNITLVEPLDNAKIENSTTFFNCTCSSDDGCIQLNMTTDGIQVNTTTNSSSNQTLVLTYTNTSIPDGDYTWYCSGSDIEITQSSDIYSFQIDTLFPINVITAPNSSFIVYEFNETIDLNWSVNDTHLDMCWYYLGYKTISDISLTGSFTSGSGVYNYSTNSIGAFKGDIAMGTQFPSGRKLISNAYDIIGTWSTPKQTEILECLAENYTNPTFYLDINDGYYFCSKTHDGFYIVNKVLTSSIEWGYYSNQTFVTCSDNHTTFNYPTTNPNNLTIWLFGNDTFGHTGFDNVTIHKNNQSPIINITSPVDSYDTLDEGDVIDLNFSISNLTILDKCWYSYNSTNVTINCSDNTTFNYEKTFNNITIYANDTLNNEGSTTKTWTVVFLEVTRSFNETLYVSQYNNFEINFSTSASSITNPILVYNGINYPSNLQLSSGLFSVSSQLTTYSNLTGNNTFHWNITLDGVNYSSINYQQNITDINFSLCDINNSISFLNIDFIDELALTPIPAIIRTSLFEYYLDDANAKSSYIYQTATNNSNYSFCFSPSDLNIIMSGSISYYADGYPERTSGTDLNLTNQSTNLTLNLLSDTAGIYATFNFIDSVTKVGLSGVNVKVYDGSTLVIEKITDDSGTISEWLNPNILYSIEHSKSGYVDGTQSIRPTSTTPYNIELSSSAFETTPELLNGLYSVVYPTLRKLDNDTVYPFGFYVKEGEQNVSLIQYTIFDENDTVIASQQKSDDGNMTITGLDTRKNSFFTGEYVIRGVDGGYYTFTIKFIITSFQQGDYSLDKWGKSLDGYFPTVERTSLTSFVWFMIWFVMMLGVFTFGYNGGAGGTKITGKHGDIIQESAGNTTLGLIFAFIITLVFSYFNLIPVTVFSVIENPFFDITWITQNFMAIIILMILIWDILSTGTKHAKKGN